MKFLSSVTMLFLFLVVLAGGGFTSALQAQPGYPYAAPRYPMPAYRPQPPIPYPRSWPAPSPIVNPYYPGGYGNGSWMPPSYSYGGPYNPYATTYGYGGMSDPLAAMYGYGYPGISDPFAAMYGYSMPSSYGYGGMYNPYAGYQGYGASSPGLPVMLSGPTVNIFATPGFGGYGATSPSTVVGAGGQAAGFPNAAPIEDHTIPYIVRFSPDGRTFAVLWARIGKDSYLGLYNVADGSMVKQFARANEPVVFSADGKQIFSGHGAHSPVTGNDYKVVVWDVATGQQVRSYSAPDDGFLDFSRDGKYALFSGDRQQESPSHS